MRQVLEVESDPFFSASVRSKQAKFRACIKQVGILWILAHNLHISFGRQVSRDVAPGLAAVRRFKNVGTKIVKHVTIESEA